MFKTTMITAFALITIAVPAAAQMTVTDTRGVPTTPSAAPAGGAQDGTMPNGSMSNDTMSHSATPAMTKSQTATMKRCQKMSSAKMAKNKSCANVQRMQGDMPRGM